MPSGRSYVIDMPVACNRPAVVQAAYWRQVPPARVRRARMAVRYVVYADRHRVRSGYFAAPRKLTGEDGRTIGSRRVAVPRGKHCRLVARFIGARQSAHRAPHCLVGLRYFRDFSHVWPQTTTMRVRLCIRSNAAPGRAAPTRRGRP